MHLSYMDFQPNLLPSLDRIKQCRILVVGDVMLDRYLYGDVNRISQEAPVPVGMPQGRTPRGASNVALNVGHWVAKLLYLVY